MAINKVNGSKTHPLEGKIVTGVGKAKHRGLRNLTRSAAISAARFDALKQVCGGNARGNVETVEGPKIEIAGKIWTATIKAKVTCK